MNIMIMNKKERLFALIFSAVLLLTAMLTGCSSKEMTELRFGTGGTGGNYYGYATNLKTYLSDAGSNCTLDVRETAGSAANLRLLSEGYLDMAIAQSDTISEALNGTGRFGAGALSGFHSVTSLYTESCQIITLKDSGIQSVEDLAGRSVSIGEENSGVISNAENILEAYGLTTNSVNTFNLSFEDAANALKCGKIDAFFITASAPTTAVVDLSKEIVIRVLSIDDPVASRMLSSDSAYVRSVIPSGTYDGQDEDIVTVGVRAVLVASDALDTGIENEIVSVLKDNNEELQDISFGVAPVETEEAGTPVIEIDMYLTLGIAVLVLFLGAWLRKKVKFIDTFCIPAPVVGGLVFAALSCALYALNIVEFSFDDTLRTVCMVMFFTSAGFQANLKVLRQGGLSLLIFLVLIAALIVCQNGIAIGLSNILGVSPLLGLCTGSIPMAGGHGTAGAFGTVLQDLGLSEAPTLCTAAATFGLVAGSLMGGPIGRSLILRKDLLKTAVTNAAEEAVLEEDEEKHRRSASMYAPAAYQLAIAMGIGTIVSMLLSKTGMTFPIYIGAMIVAAIMRNLGEYTGKFRIHMGEINDLGGICLNLFLGIAMITLKLWQLADLALPLITLLLAQTLFMMIFSYFVVYNIMGRDYDAAIISAGTCGFGMGATPNAMANMQALTDKYLPSVKAYLLVPIVGSMFVDFINSITITFFINLL